MTVSVVTGSQTCLPGELADSYRIAILPYTLEMDDKQYRDGVDITPDEFYRRMPLLDGSAHTSAITPGTFIEAFDRLSGNTQGILVITISSQMSTVYSNACLAASSYEGVPVRVLDSGTAAIAQGFVTLEAAEAALKGASLDECYEVACNAAERVELYAYISTFEYLRRSGRVNTVKAFAANALSIKPVFRFKKGEAVLAAKKRSVVKAQEYIAERTLDFRLERGLSRLSVFHAAASEEARDLAQLIVEVAAFESRPLYTEFTPVMGIHTGPGVVGAAFL